MTSAVRAVLGGVPLRELPPSTLGELAAVAGNSGMLALAELSRNAPALVECPSFGDGGPAATFEVPELECPRAVPAEFPTEAAPGPGCDPAALGAWGGGP